MANPHLAPLLVDRATRRRLTRVPVSGQTTSTHMDVAAVPCAVRAKSAKSDRTGYGRVQEAEYLVTLQPDAEVAVGDLLLVTSGSYAGEILAIRFVHRGSHIEFHKAEAERLQAAPPSTPAAG